MDPVIIEAAGALGRAGRWAHRLRRDYEPAEGVLEGGLAFHLDNGSSAGRRGVPVPLPRTGLPACDRSPLARCRMAPQPHAARRPAARYVARRTGAAGRLHPSVEDGRRPRASRIGELWLVQLGWDIRLFIDGEFQCSKVCRTEDEVFDTIDVWRDALMAKGWTLTSRRLGYGLAARSFSLEGIDTIDHSYYTSAWPWDGARIERGHRRCGSRPMSCRRPVATRSISA